MQTDRQGGAFFRAGMSLGSCEERAENHDEPEIFHILSADPPCEVGAYED